MHYIQLYYTHWAAICFLFFGIMWSNRTAANVVCKMLMIISAVLGAALVFGVH